MKVCAIQQPYPYTVAEAEKAVEFVIREFDSCDDSLDLILTPEYTNCPTSFPPGESLEFAKKHTARLEKAAIDAAVRCNCIVALSYCAPTPYGWRNTTRIFDRSGKAAGDYYKLQLTEREPVARQVEESYRWNFQPPQIVEVDGLRLGFVTCYDAYFNEYIEFLGCRQPDIVLVASHQRAEPCSNLRLLNQMLAYYTGAFVVRASVGMGSDAEVGGTSMVVDPAGVILADSGQNNGKLICEIGDPHRKYFRSDSFGGKMILNRQFVEKGRTPWSYRPCGPFVVRSHKQMPYPRICACFSNDTVQPLMAAIGSAVALDADEVALEIAFAADNILTVFAVGEFESSCIAGKSFAGLEQDYPGRIVKLENVLRKFARHAVFDLHISLTDCKKLQDLIVSAASLLEIYDCSGHAFFSGESTVLELAQKYAPQVARSLDAAASSDDTALLQTAQQYACSSVMFCGSNWDAVLTGQLHEQKIACRCCMETALETAEYFTGGIDTVLTTDILSAERSRNAFIKKN